MRDEFRRWDTATTLGRLMRMSTAILGGGLELYGRATEIGARHLTGATEALLEGLSAGERERLAALWQRGRGLLSELAVSAPLAAQFAAREMRARPGVRVLAYARPQPAPGEHSVHWRSAVPVLPALPAEGLYASGAAAKALAAQRDRQAVEPLDAALVRQLEALFAGIGHPLSKSISLLAAPHAWTLRDHTRGNRFSIAPNGSLLEILGEDEGLRYVVAGKKLPVPTRVFDASQGMAFYSVPLALIQGELDKHKRLGLNAWQTDERHGVLAVFMVDYRESELGSYREFGVGCLVAPAQEPLAVGLHTLFLGVTDPFACDAGERVWGYPKTLHEIDIEYGEDRATCRLWRDAQARADGAPPLLSLAVPRRGEGGSRDLPLCTYTVKHGALHRVVVTRSGEGEDWTRERGAVQLSLDPMAGASRANKLLRGLGLRADDTDHLLFASWTENMTAELDAPELIPFRAGET